MTAVHTPRLAQHPPGTVTAVPTPAQAAQHLAGLALSLRFLWGKQPRVGIHLARALGHLLGPPTLVLTHRVAGGAVGLDLCERHRAGERQPGLHQLAGRPGRSYLQRPGRGHRAAQLLFYLWSLVWGSPAASTTDSFRPPQPEARLGTPRHRTAQRPCPGRGQGGWSAAKPAAPSARKTRHSGLSPDHRRRSPPVCGW